MLRITTLNHETKTEVVVEGKLSGPWVAELERCWQTAVSTQPCSPILIDLTAVSYVDAEGKELLTRMRRNGAEILVTGLMNKAIFDSNDR
jgi:anti-anti-sigma regulatory factor